MADQEETPSAEDLHGAALRRKRALLRQMKKTLQAYKDPEKLDPKFRETIDETIQLSYAKHNAKFEEKYAEMQERARKWDELKEQNKKKARLAPSSQKRKVKLTSSS